MKVVLSTIGRFHIFPLARELERHGALECVFSGMPWTKLAREGVSRERVKTFPWLRTLAMAARFLPFTPPARLMDWLSNLSYVSLDRHVSKVLPDADIFVGHEGVGLLSGVAAQARSMVYVCDRGCAHAGWRARIVQAEYKRLGLAPLPLPATHARELAEYAQADLIVVPSQFVARTFIEEGFAPERLAVVPYGADTGRFFPVAAPPDDRFEVLFVGALSPEKGARDLLEAFRDAAIANKRLTLVGMIRPEVWQACGELLKQPGVEIVGHVAHGALKERMSRSHVLVLPSLQDGFGMVVAEAMACGCPVIVSKNAGAADLVAEGENGFVVPVHAPEVIAARLALLASDRDRQRAMGQAAMQTVRQLGGWESYGNAMLAVFQHALDAKRGGHGHG